MKTFKRVCKWCGKEFETESNRREYCGDDYIPCVVCGAPIKIKNMSSLPKTCSKKCQQEQTRRVCLERYGSTTAVNSNHAKDLAKQHCLEKYGVEHYSQTEEYKSKFKRTMQARYGVDSPLQSETIKAKVRATNIERYGGASPSCDAEVAQKAKATALCNHGGFGWASPELKARIDATMQARYGATNPMLADEIRNRAQQTNIERYGAPNAMQSAEVRARAETTCLLKYGSKSPMCAPEIQAKTAATVRARYGVDNVSKLPEVIQKAKDKFIENYGVSNPMKSPEIQAKVQATCYERYGARSYNASEIAVLARITDPTKADNYIQFKQNGQQFISSRFSQPPTLLELSRELGVDIATVSAQIQIQQLGDSVVFHQSDIERQLISLIHSFDSKLEIQQFNRSVITPQEIDIYLPELKLGIECNPTITHNSSFRDPWGGDPKSYKYHQEKSLRCRDAEVFLFHIFGYEWTHKRTIIESMLRNLVNANEHRVFARNTYVVELSSSECRAFLDANHRQGATNASIRLGLKLKSTDELVSVMTFNMLRKTIGVSNTTDTEYTMELSRFCNKLNTSVVGGASKLFKYFIKCTSAHKIISFSDIAHTRGGLYSTLGFKQVSESGPGYVWVSLLDDSYLNRVSCQKSNLRNLFHDDSIDVENKTEREIMMEHGYAQVFDSGTIRWEYDI